MLQREVIWTALVDDFLLDLGYVIHSKMAFASNFYEEKVWCAAYIYYSTVLFLYVKCHLIDLWYLAWYVIV